MAAAAVERTTALHNAVERGDVAAVVRLHAEDGVDLESHDLHNGRSAMVIAAARCDADMLEQLYALGADPNAADGTGTYPLFEAAVATDPSLEAQMHTLVLMTSWHGVDLDVEPDDFGTLLEHLCATVPPPHLRERVGAVVRLLLLAGAVLYRGGLTCRPVRDELLRRVREWLATQSGLELFLSGCHHGAQADGTPSLARALRNAPMVRRRIGHFVPVLSPVEVHRLRAAAHELQCSVDDELYHAETHAFSHVTCHAM